MIEDRRQQFINVSEWIWTNDKQETGKRSELGTLERDMLYPDRLIDL